MPLRLRDEVPYGGPKSEFIAAPFGALGSSSAAGLGWRALENPSKPPPTPLAPADAAVTPPNS